MDAELVRGLCWLAIGLAAGWLARRQGSGFGVQGSGERRRREIAARKAAAGEKPRPSPPPPPAEPAATSPPHPVTQSPAQPEPPADPTPEQLAEVQRRAAAQVMKALSAGGLTIANSACCCPLCVRAMEVFRLCTLFYPKLGPRAPEAVRKLLAISDQFERRIAEAAAAREKVTR